MSKYSLYNSLDDPLDVRADENGVWVTNVSPVSYDGVHNAGSGVQQWENIHIITRLCVPTIVMPHLLTSATSLSLCMVIVENPMITEFQFSFPFKNTEANASSITFSSMV